MHARAAARPGGARRHADEPAVRRPGGRHQRQAGGPVVRGRRLLRGTGPGPPGGRRLQQAPHVAPAGPGAPGRAWPGRGVRSPRAGPAVLLRPRIAGQRRHRAASRGRPQGLRARHAGAGRLRTGGARSLRSGPDSVGAPPCRGAEGIVVVRHGRPVGSRGEPARTGDAGGRFGAQAAPRRRAHGAGARRRRHPGGRRQQRALAGPGDGSRHQPAVPGRRTRRRRHRRRVVRHAHPPARRAYRPGAPGPRARSDRAVDGGSLPPRLRPPDHGQRRAGAALLAGRRRRPAGQVQPQSGRARAVDPGAGQAVGHARRAVRAGPGPGRPRRRAHARRSRQRAGAVARGERVRPGRRRRFAHAVRAGRRPPGRQRGRAGFPDRPAGRAAATGQVAVPLRRRQRPPRDRDGPHRRGRAVRARCAGRAPERADGAGAVAGGRRRRRWRLQGRDHAQARGADAAGRRLRREEHRRRRQGRAQRAGAQRRDGCQRSAPGTRAGDVRLRRAAAAGPGHGHCGRVGHGHGRRRRDARSLLRGSRRSHRRCAREPGQARRRPAALRIHLHRPPRVPHPQGQFAHGRPARLRRRRLGLRTAVQRPSRRRRDRGRSGAAHVLAESPRRARGLGQGAHRPQRRRLPQRAHHRGRQRPARRPRPRCRAGEDQARRRFGRSHDRAVARCGLPAGSRGRGSPGHPDPRRLRLHGLRRTG